MYMIHASLVSQGFENWNPQSKASVGMLVYLSWSTTSTPREYEPCTSQWPVLQWRFSLSSSHLDRGWHALVMWCWKTDCRTLNPDLKWCPGTTIPARFDVTIVAVVTCTAADRQLNYMIVCSPSFRYFDTGLWPHGYFLTEPHLFQLHLNITAQTSSPIAISTTLGLPKLLQLSLPCLTINSWSD